MKNTTALGLAVLLVVTAAIGTLGGRALASSSLDPQRSKMATTRTEPASLPDDSPVELGEFVETAPSAVDASGSHEMQALRFVHRFDAAHASGDLEFLVAMLHPAAEATFGQQRCLEYTRATMGSVQNMTVIEIGEPTTFVLPTPGGELEFVDAIPVSAEWINTQNGETDIGSFHIVPADGQLHWLTTCGWHGEA